MQLFEQIGKNLRMEIDALLLITIRFKFWTMINITR